MDKTLSHLKTLTAFCQKHPDLISHLDDFPKLYEFSKNYPALISHADEALSAYEYNKKFRQLSRDEMKALMGLTEALKDSEESGDSEEPEDARKSGTENVSKTKNNSETDSVSKTDVVLANPETNDAEDNTVTEPGIEPVASDNVSIDQEIVTVTTEDIVAEPEAEAQSEAEANSDALDSDCIDVVDLDTNETLEAVPIYKPKAGSPEAAPTKRKLDETEHLKLRELIERGYSQVQVAKMIGCKPYHVGNQVTRGHGQWPTEWIEKIRELDLENMPEKPRNKPKSKAPDVDEAPEEPA